MIIIGLTGSIGMGKTETAKMFRALGVPVFDADSTVHALYAEGGAAVAPVGEAFPGVVVAGAVDRERLSRRVVGDEAAIRRLERIVHPLVGAAQRRFLAEAEEAGHQMVVIDVPLLYEGGGEGRYDAVVVVSAPYEIQRERVLARPGMTEEKFADIVKRQVPDEVKREKADFVIDTSKGLDHARAQVAAAIAEIAKRRAGAEPAEAGRG